MVKIFSKEDKKKIVQTIAQAEKMTSGEIRVHIFSKKCTDPMLEARRVFKKLKMHKTLDQNAVLLFVSPQSRVFALLGDEGIHRKVGQDFWDKVRDKILNHFSSDHYLDGILEGVLEIGKSLSSYFPRKSDDHNELENAVTEG